MEIFYISAVAFLASVLTFFSGFGLGTLLAPVFMLFFPVELAIALTGLVHFFNNIFKLFLVGRYADKIVLIRFGIPALIASFIGSTILLTMADSKSIYAYQIFSNTFQIFPLKLIIAILLLLFSIIDLVPYFQKIHFDKNKLSIGGFLSGFFGGLSGMQGALRSAFLIKAGLSKEAYIGTAVVVSSFVDITRLSVYASKLQIADLKDNLLLLVCATSSAIIGAVIGNQLLQKTTINLIKKLVAIMIIIIAFGIGSGVL